MIAGVAMIAVAGVSAPASAQLFGGIVYDPTNYAQNVLTAARSLQQIHNQIQSLQNEASSLINEENNLASLPFSSLQQLQAQVRQNQQLHGQETRLAYDVQQNEQAVSTRFRNMDLNDSDQSMISAAHNSREDARAGLRPRRR